MYVFENFQNCSDEDKHVIQFSINFKCYGVFIYLIESFDKLFEEAVCAYGEPRRESSELQQRINYIFSKRNMYNVFCSCVDKFIEQDIELYRSSLILRLGNIVNDVFTNLSIDCYNDDN